MSESREHIRIGLNVAALIVSVSSLVIYYVIKPNDDELNSYRIWLTVAAVILGIYAAYMARKTTLVRDKQRVFIMYTPKDFEAAQELVNKLRTAGFNPWFDVDEVAPGQRIFDAVRKGIQQSSAAVLLVSKSMQEPSNFLKLQIDMALNLLPSKSSEFSPIIPVQIDEAPIPELLKDVNSIKWGNEKEFERLVKGLTLIFDRN